MPNPFNLPYPPDFWRTAEPHADRKVLLVGAGLGPNPFSGSLRFLGPYVRQQPQGLPDNWRQAGAVAQATRSTPVLQGHLTHPPFAEAAQHDIGPLHGVETTLKALAPKAEDIFWTSLHRITPLGSLIEVLERGFGNKPGDVEKSVGAGALRSVGSAVRGVGAFDDSATRSVTRLMAGEQGVADYNRRRAQGDFAPMPGDLFTAISNPLFDTATWLKQGVRDTPLTRTSEAAGNLAPGLLVSVANPWAGAGYFAAQGADSQNQAAIRAGKAGTWQADLGVLGNAGVQGSLGLIPGGKFERLMPRFASPAANLAVKAGTRTTAGSAAGALSNVSGNAIEKATVNPDKNIWDGTLESILTGGLLSAGHVGVETVRGTSAKARASRPEFEAHSGSVPAGDHADPVPSAAIAPEPHPAMKAVKAVADHHNLTAAVHAARDSVLRQEDPDQFQAYAASVAETSQIPDLHIAPDALDAVLATPEGQRVQAAIPDLADRVVAARDAGTDVPITADEYLTHVGPELHDQIAGDVRVGPDAMTPAEAVADHQGRVAALENASAEAEANANDPEAFRQSRQDVTDAIREQYDRETVGKLAPQQRAAAAELSGHAFAVEAAKQGVEPMEVYRQATRTEQNPSTSEAISNLPEKSVLPEAASDHMNAEFQTNMEDASVETDILTPPGVAPEAKVPGPPKIIDLATRADYRTASQKPKPNTTYRYNDLHFVTDNLGRGIISEGELTLGSGGNRFHDDRLIGYPHNPDAIEGDIGFHAGGDQFGFPGGKLNVFPGNAKLNSASGAYGKFEQEVLKPLAADPHKRVHAKFIRLFYDGNISTRPDELRITYTVDGKSETVSFQNTEGE